jgi:hypothetical protein
MDLPTLDQALDAVMASRESRREYLASSGWLEDRDLDEIEAIEADLGARFEQYLASARGRLGQPVYDDQSDRDAVDAWYPEATRLDAWPHRDGLVFLTLEHPDREAPISVVVGYVTQDEIDELSADEPEPAVELSFTWISDRGDALDEGPGRRRG